MPPVPVGGGPVWGGPTGGPVILGGGIDPIGGATYTGYYWSYYPI